MTRIETMVIYQTNISRYQSKRSETRVDGAMIYSWILNATAYIFNFSVYCTYLSYICLRVLKNVEKSWEIINRADW